MTKFQKQMMTIVAAGALSAVTALPAMAADVNFYGLVRMDTYLNTVTTAAGDDLRGTDMHLRGDSRFGANFKNGAFSAKFELGAGDADDYKTTVPGTLPNASAADNTVSLRLLYGTWNYGSGKLTIGQDYTPYTMLSDQGHGTGSSIGYGSTYDGRIPQIRVNLNNGLYFAAIESSSNISNFGQETSATAGNDAYLPKLNVGYAGKAGNMTYNVGVVGQTFKNKTVDEQVNSAMVYFGGTAAFGDTSLKYNLSYGANVGNLGLANRMSYDTTTVNNVTGFEGYLQLSQKLNSTVSLNVGAGYVTDKSRATGAEADDKLLAYINLPIKMASALTVIPEFAYYDQLDEVGAADSDAKNWAIGAKWQFAF